MNTPLLLEKNGVTGSAALLGDLGTVPGNLSGNPSDIVPFTNHSLKDRECLYQQGDICGDVFAVETGYLKLSRLSSAGVQLITAILGEGQLFGPGLRGGNTANQTVVAKGAATIRRYNGAGFRQRVGHDHAVAQATIAVLARREERAERRLQALLTMNVRSRIALVLIDLANDYGSRCKHGHDIDVPLTQQELADLVGASRQMVSTELNQLRRDGLLSYRRGFICIDDLVALQLLC